ncbi:MAG: DEAD/DEAH box helicase [Lentisphaeraceae bacterium]|nr:DEAD/DEAH box helicase [Lentisphaeraceae bacterium]
MEKFIALGLREDIISAISEKGFTEPSPVQEQVIPILLNEQTDIIAMAQTGTGKTAAFGLPLCNQITPSKDTKALVLAPTRELAVQVCQEMSSFTPNSKLKIFPVYGGQPFRDQARALERGVDIVVGTPGRVIDMIQRGKLILDDLDFLVLDEVDEMLNMGFIEDIEFILDCTPKDAQRLMFSATLPKRIENIAKKYLTEPKTVKVERSKDIQNLIEHVYYETSRAHRLEALNRILTLEEDFYGIIFCQTKAETEVLSSELNNNGISAEYLHGDIAQKSRETILNRFKSQKSKLLVATDVAARGIDVDSLTHVINFSVPESDEAYTHRCGRTGRKGQKGKAITLAVSNEIGRLKRIMRATSFTIEKKVVPDGKSIAFTKKEQFNKKLTTVEPSESNKEVAAKLVEEHNPEEVISKLLELHLGNAFDTNAYKTLPTQKDHGEETLIRIEKGIADDFTGRTLIPFIEKKGGVAGRSINNLRIKRHFCTFSVPTKDAKAIVASFNKRCETESGKPFAVEEGPAKSSDRSGGRKFSGRRGDRRDDRRGGGGGGRRGDRRDDRRGGGGGERRSSRRSERRA